MPSLIICSTPRQSTTLMAEKACVKRPRKHERILGCSAAWS
jgi:hypothetical protein